MFPALGRILPFGLYRAKPVGIVGRLAPWNVTRASSGTVSYVMLDPARITVVPLPITSQANPTRGPKSWRLVEYSALPLVCCAIPVGVLGSKLPNALCGST